MGPGFDARYVTLVLRIGRGYVGMAHLGGRVRIVRVVGGRYVLHGGEGRLELVISDYLRLGSIFPGSIDHWLIRAVSLVRSLHFLVVSAKSVAFHPAKCSGADRNYRVSIGRILPSMRRRLYYLLNSHWDEVVVGAAT